MNLLPLRQSLTLVTVFAALCATHAPVMALEPAESTRVDMVTVGDLYGKVSADNTSTLLVGVEGCELAVEKGGDIQVTFSTPNFDTSTTTPPLTGYGYVNVYYFNQGIDVGNSPACLTDTTSCTVVDSSKITRSMTNVVAQVSFKTMTGLTTQQACSTSSLMRDYFVRLQFREVSLSTPDQADARIRVDLVRPEPPTGFDAVVTEDAIRLSWSDEINSDVETYRIVYRAEQFDGGGYSKDIMASARASVINTATNTSTTSISDLEPGSTVWLAVASVDAVGNESVLTAPQPFVVIDTVDFWDAYKGGGGSEEGGFCSAAPHAGHGSSPPFLLLCGLLVGFGATRARRTRHHGARS